jgi:hypothetical protein
LSDPAAVSCTGAVWESTAATPGASWRYLVAVCATRRATLRAVEGKETP